MATLCCTKRPALLGNVPMLLAVTALAALVVAGCRRSESAGDTTARKKETPDNAVRVETVEVERRDLTQSIELPGTVEGYETAELYAKVGGYLKEMRVDIGDRVEKDQVLAKISVPEMLKELDHKQAGIAYAQAKAEQARAAVRQAEAQLAAAKAGLEEARSQREEKQALWRFREAEYRRIKGLVDSGALLSQRLDEVKFQLEAAAAVLAAVEARIRTAEANGNVAQADLEKANADRLSALAQVDVARADFQTTQTMLQYAEIRAPFDGVVIKRWVHPGAFVQPAENNSAAKPLLTVTRTDRVRILVDLPMAEVRLLDRGDRAVLDRINVLPGKEYRGRVKRFSGALDVASRMMRVEIELPNPDGSLLPGCYGYVTLFLEELPQTPIVPSSALLANGTDSYVFVVRKGTCRKRVVTVSYQDGAIVGIASGLDPGEQVVRSGGGQLTDGQPVRSALSQAETASG